MALPESYLQILRECSCDEASLQRLIQFVEPLVETQAERTQRETYQSRLSAIVESSGEAIYGCDLEGLITSWNPAAERIYGYTAEEIIGKSIGVLPPPERMGEMIANRMKIMRGEHIDRFESVRLHKDGTRLNMAVSISPILDKSGAVVGAASITQDITHIKQMEMALQKSEAQLRSIFETIEDAVWSIELPGHTMSYMSPSIQRITGYSAEAFYANDDLRYEMIHPDDVLMVRQNNQLDPDGNLSYSFEHRIVRPDHTVRWIHNRGWLVRDEHNQPVRIEGIMSDITERKLLQQQTLELEIEHKRIALLSDFITNTSHELRNPLSTISTGLYLITRLEDRNQREQKADSLKLEIHYLNRMIEQLHQMAQLDALKNVDTASISLNALVRSVTNNYTQIKDRIRLFHHLASEPLTIYGNRDYLALALSHLLGNAVRFSSEPREITIRSRLEDDAVLLEVADHGVGIAPEHLPHIFEHFYKVDPARTHNDSGAGMGLAIVKRIMQLHHGEVTVESEPGRGSTFKLHFPRT